MRVLGPASEGRSSLLRPCFQEVLGKALQHAARLVDRHFFGGVQAAGHRHFDTLAIAPVTTSVSVARGVRSPSTS
jgi:hypothetical protein